MSSESQSELSIPVPANEEQSAQPNPTPGSFASAREQRRWNNLSEKMSSFHEWFKQEFNTLYELADGSFTTRGLSLVRYLETAKAMNHHLTMHHTIEERYLFPILGKTMPQFAAKDNGAHIASHHGIHEGLDRLGALVKKWTSAPSEYSPDEMRACLDSFRDVLFHHLDEEARYHFLLGCDN
ncbi:hypothetical protein CVT25_005844 [Psilocybe cyanescens]|uniref:Hemerythrin-like domain-containing protein n=1 Tax=Psilocybe cyanescens TaxID=93625 RepID=A0A409VLX6_PSICY|nr:hypothetical protein CVT25_005844 [Psilocybe cyanescens]